MKRRRGKVLVSIPRTGKSAGSAGAPALPWNPFQLSFIFPNIFQQTLIELAEKERGTAS